MLELTINSCVEFDVRDAPPQLLEAWREAFTIANPAYVDAVRQGRYATNLPRELCGHQQHGHRVRFRRGGLSRMRRIAAEHGVPLSYVDERNVGELLELKHTRELRDYQARAVSELAKRQQGMAVAPAGAGKTSTAIGFIERVHCTTLILVGTVDLAEQWRSEIRAQLGIEAGLIGAGKSQVRSVTVAIVASLAQLPDDALATVMAPFGALIVDEAHHAVSPTWARIVDACASKYRIGLTATPERQDGLTPLLEWLIGPYVDVVDHAALLDSGRLVAPRIIRLETEFEFDYYGPEDWPRLLEALVTNDARNRLIVDSVSADASAGHSVLVLTGRVSHAEDLANGIASRGVTSACLHGRTPRRLRSHLLGRVRDGQTRVLVATQLADEGLDLPCLSRVYLVFPARAAGRTEQRIGRVMRPAPGKLDAAVVDVVDVNVGVLRHQARKRAAVFRDVLGPSAMERSA